MQKYIDSLLEQLRSKAYSEGSITNYRLMLKSLCRFMETHCVDTYSYVDLEGGILTLLHTKGNVERIVPMHPTLNEILHRYCLAMGLIGDPDAYVFPGMTNDYAITKDCAQGRFERILKRVAIEKKGKKPHERGPCLHCFRNVFILKSIMQAEKSGVSINVHSTYLPTYLGHKSMLNTDRYIRFRNTRFPETLMAFEEFTDGIFPEVCDE
jgi:integrase